MNLCGAVVLRLRTCEMSARSSAQGSSRCMMTVQARSSSVPCSRETAQVDHERAGQSCQQQAQLVALELVATGAPAARLSNNTPASLLMSPPSNDASIMRRPSLPGIVGSDEHSTVQFGIGDSGCY